MEQLSDSVTKLTADVHTLKDAKRRLEQENDDLERNVRVATCLRENAETSLAEKIEQLGLVQCELDELKDVYEHANEANKGR